MNAGPVIKVRPWRDSLLCFRCICLSQQDHNNNKPVQINANARYATNSPGIVLAQEVARGAKVPLQLFVVRNDSSCGSTIGPMLSAAVGMRTVDMGNAQLSMHSIRETG